MIEVLDTVARIVNPAALAAFIVALFYFYNANRLKLEELKIDKLPPEDRARYLDQSLARYRIDASNATREEKYQLIKHEMDNRFRQNNNIGKLICIVVIFCFGVTAFAYVYVANNEPPPNPTPAPPPELFGIQPDTTALPAELFGEKEDPTKPRQWEKYLVFGIHHELKKPTIVYLITDPFPAPGYEGFTLYVNVNTQDTVIPLAFLARKEGDAPVLIPLRQADHRQGPRQEYRYAVPPISRENDRLVVILGMEKDTYDRIAQPSKFVLSSKPLKQ